VRGSIAVCIRNRIAPSLLLASSPVPVQAQEMVLTQGSDGLSFPSVARIALGFVVSAALALGIALVLRHVLPKLGGRTATSSRLRLLDRIHLSSTVRAHLLEVEGERVLVAENRGAITMVVLSSTGSRQSAEP
jgi:flagellar biogenesis protein FliO